MYFCNDPPQFSYVCSGCNAWRCSVEKVLESACLIHSHFNCLRGAYDLLMILTHLEEEELCLLRMVEMKRGLEFSECAVYKALHEQQFDITTTIFGGIERTLWK